MGHWSEPKVVIPPYDAPPGTLMYIRTKEGLLTYQKETDGGWAVVAFDGKAGTKFTQNS